MEISNDEEDLEEVDEELSLPLHRYTQNVQASPRRVRRSRIWNIYKNILYNTTEHFPVLLTYLKLNTRYLSHSNQTEQLCITSKHYS